MLLRCYLCFIDKGSASCYKHLPTVGYRFKILPESGSMHPRSLKLSSLTLGKVLSDTSLINIFIDSPHCEALEFATQGLARATSHRVLSPRAAPGEPTTPRYSVPFFQNISLDARLTDIVLDCMCMVLAYLSSLISYFNTYSSTRNFET